jgi:hypothetical protein
LKLKNRIATTTSRWPGNTVLSFVPFQFAATYGTLTLTLPYAGAIRIRFKGLPDCRQALSLL